MKLCSNGNIGVVTGTPTIGPGRPKNMLKNGDKVEVAFAAEKILALAVDLAQPVDLDMFPPHHTTHTNRHRSVSF